MKKVILSAFAMSLIIFQAYAQGPGVDEFLEITPKLKGKQNFTPENLHQLPEWNISEKQVILDKDPFKGQSHSIIPWSRLDPEEWLDIDRWLIERQLKDKIPDWKMRLRDDHHLELVGKIIKCVGTCQIHRGINGVNVQYLSRILEGDELKTEKDSVAWVYLMSGALMRVGPESSVSLQEITLSSTEASFLIRLNKGHVFWHPRSLTALETETGHETDAVSLPLMIKEANVQYFERIEHQKKIEFNPASEILDVGEIAARKQIELINELRVRHSDFMIPTSVIMVSPNVTITSTQTSFDFVFVPGGQSFFKNREPLSVGKEFSAQMRGYSENQIFNLEELNWYEVEPTGRSFNLMSEVPAHLQVIELLTKRIRTIELAREIWNEKFTKDVLTSLKDPKTLAVEHGYALWEEKNLKLRKTFLYEYTRRIETTNLRSLENLLEKLTAQGEKAERELGPDYYQHAINRYLLGLKSMYTSRTLQVRDMNDLQYYVWILKNGKL